MARAIVLGSEKEHCRAKFDHVDLVIEKVCSHDVYALLCRVGCEFLLSLSRLSRDS